MKYLLYIFIIVILISCDDNEVSQNETKVETFDNKVFERIITTTPSKYSNYFFSDAEMVGYSTLKEHSLAERVLVPVVNEKSGDLKSAGSGVTFLANGLELKNSKNLKSGKVIDVDNYYKNWYGTDVTFVLKSGQQLKSGGGEVTGISMYIPDLVEITAPAIETEEELYPYCFYDNFRLAWNADEKNENGLVVMVEWLGTTLSQSDDSNQYVRNIDVIEVDNGEAILDNRLFENIPDKALAYITLLRGNIEIAEIEGAAYRLFGESHAVLPFILIRNIKIN